MTDPLSAAARALLGSFRRQRPLRGGSRLVTIFGDAIAPRGGAITLGSLIALAAPFGLNQRLVRTAMARLAGEGWLENRMAGRRSEYRLSRGGRERFFVATRQIYGVPQQKWPGSWTMIIVPPAARAIRQAAREALGWAGFGEPTPGLFAHPLMTVAEVEQLIRGTAELTGVVVLTTGASPAASHRQLVALGWDSAELAQRYRRFIRQFEPALSALRGRGRPAALPSFIVRTLLVHEYRKIHLRDPMLPPELLPVDWVGSDAYRLCRAVYARVAARAEQYLDTQATTLHGQLPSAGAELYGRFGGLAIVGPGTVKGLRGKS